MNLRKSDLLPSRQPLAIAGLFGTAFVVVCVIAAVWLSNQALHQSRRADRESQLTAIGEVVRQGAESMLAAGDSSALRRFVIEAARSHRLAVCRVTLADGRIIADSDLTQVAVVDLPEDWGQSAAPASSPTATDDVQSTVSFVLSVPGEGLATLEVALDHSLAGSAAATAMSGLCMIGIFGLLAHLALIRWLQSRLRGGGVVQEAIIAWQSGEKHEAALRVNPDGGPEAVAWNAFLDEHVDLREAVTAKETSAFLEQRTSQNSDLSLALDAIWDGVLLVDADFHIECGNGAAAVMLQSTREEIIGTDVRTCVPAEAVESITALLTGESRASSTLELEADPEAGDGVLRYSIRPIRDDVGSRALVVIEDITQQRAADDARQAFISQAAHELRTPLSNIRLYVDMAIEDDEEDPEVRGRCFNVIGQESQRLERIVGDMLSVSEIEAGSLSLQLDDVDLPGLFNRMDEEYRAQASDKSITLKFNLPPKLPIIRADRDKLVLVLHNLVGNALKYTPDGGDVAVNATAEGEQIIIEVVDTGIGINPEEADKVFEKFYRANDTRIASITGSGLGLALAREVIRLHGGEISVETAIDQGSTFRVALPTRKAA